MAHGVHTFRSVMMIMFVLLWMIRFWDFYAYITFVSPPGISGQNF